jgi:hypothetical protein
VPPASPGDAGGRSIPRCRSGYPNHPQPGERIAIHAAARPVRREEVKDLQERLVSDHDTTGLVPKLADPLLVNVLMSYKCQLLPLGAVLGTAVIGKPQSPPSPYHNWARPLTAIERFDVPVPARGQQRFWEWRA